MFIYLLSGTFIMATYDNKIWLLKNIRDAFIATDDTGLCEIVMAGDDFSKIFQNKAIEERKRIREGRLNQHAAGRTKDGMGDISEDENDREIVTQFDPYPCMGDSEDDDQIGSYVRYEEFGGHRQRSNTAQWLDKKEQALKKAAKIKVIKWEDSSPLTSDEVAEMFPKVEVVKPEPQKSLLAQQLLNCPNLPHRQYLEYAKFDGTAQIGLLTKSFKIFMTMLSERHQNYPVGVCVIANAKIKDLIGFTCYKYSIEHPEVTLGSVHDYGLCIAEDDGEVDWAFPCLDANEPCSKFGFTCLGLILIEQKKKNSYVSEPIALPEDVILSSGDFHNILHKSSGSHQNPSRNYTDGSATSEAVLSAVKAVNEVKGTSGTSTDMDKIHQIATDAPQYKSYKVNLLRKVRTNTTVSLVISLDRIEVEPLVAQKHAFWSRSKYFLHSIDTIAWCQILETRGNRSTFRIVYSPSHSAGYGDRNSTGNTSYFLANATYKLHDFECEHDTAREIVDRVNTILDLRNSPCRREYKVTKDRKIQTRRSFQRQTS